MTPAAGQQAGRARRRLGLRGKFLLLTTALMAGFGIVVGAISMEVQEGLIRGRLHRNARATASLLAETAANPLSRLDLRQLRLLLSYTKGQEDVIYAYVLDAGGRVLADGTLGNPLRDHVLEDPLGPAAVAAEAYLEQTTGEVLDAAQPVLVGGTKLGAVRIGFSLEGISRDVARAHRRTAGIALGLVLAGVAITAALVRRITRPLRRLIEGTREVSRGDYRSSIRAETDDEVGDLARSFNEMTRALRRTAVSRRTLDNILSSMRDAVLVSGPDLRIRSANPAAGALLGCRPEELVGRPLSEVIGQGSGCPWDEVPEGPAGGSWRAPDGRDVAVVHSCAPLRNPGGGVEGIVCCAQDATRVREAERQLWTG